MDPRHPATVIPGQIRAIADAFCLIKVPNIG